MNMNEAPDYAAVLADLRTRRAQLDVAIEALESVVDVPVNALRSSALNVAMPTRRAAKSFVGLSVLDAAKKHLQRTGHALRTTEILSALQQGGVALTGKSPINSLGAILNSNLRKGNGIVREQRGVWALPEWHAPASVATNGSRMVEVTRLLRGVAGTTAVADQPAQVAVTESDPLASPATSSVLHA